MLKLKRCSIFLLFLFAGLITQAGAQQLTIHQQIDSIFAEYNASGPGLAIAVVKDGKIDYKKGYGLANLDHELSITPGTKFHVASVSKQFTAFAIYLLKKEGKLSLEDDVRKFIPELPVYSRPIKIRHLLAHTSGLRDQWALLTLAGWNMEDVITTGQILKLVTSQKGLNFEPDSRFGYSNTGYTLLAEVVRRVSGESLAVFASKHIFLPLGMTGTLFNDDLHQVIKGRAQSYELAGGKYEERKLNFSTAGATSLITTVEDLAKWVNNFENPVVGDRELMKEFNAVSRHDDGRPVIWSVSPGDTTFHAKGQLHWKHKGVSVISHGGHDAGFRAVLMRFPGQGLSVITLSNNEHYTMARKVLPVAELYLKDALVSVATLPAVNRQAPKEEFTNRLEEFPGIYESEELSTRYSIIVKDGRLIMTHARLADMPLTAVGRDKFSGINSFAIEIEFIREAGKIEGFAISNFGVQKLKFVKTR